MSGSSAFGSTSLICDASATTASMYSSLRDSGTSRRVSAEQVCPEFMKQANTDAIADGCRIGVVEHDVGGLAAELETDALDGVGRGPLHLGSGPAGAGEADHVDVGVRDDRRAHLGTGADHQVEHTGGQAHLVDDLGEDVGVERGDLRRLEHDGAAGGQCRGHLADDQVQRVVPRRDGTDDADGLADHQRVADLSPRTRSPRSGWRRSPTRPATDRPGPSRRRPWASRPRWRWCRRCRRSGRRARHRCRAGTWPGCRSGSIDQVSNASRAAATAASTSAAVPSGTRRDDLLGGGVDHVDRVASGGRHPCPPMYWFS